MLGTDLRAKIVYHVTIVIGTVLAPFLARALQRNIVNPVAEGAVYVAKHTARFLWQALVFTLLSSILINSLPYIAQLTLDTFAEYDLYDKWPFSWAFDFIQYAAQKAAISWFLSWFAGLTDALAGFLKIPFLGGSFVFSQLNETWSKIVN